ncbi:hypothetical protein HQ529_03890 [Candidatus Woesearchaeota archaeon]|nr:hypothetical protein [Candidatus Woesearchaeota archaeon]
MKRNKEIVPFEEFEFNRGLKKVLELFNCIVDDFDSNDEIKYDVRYWLYGPKGSNVLSKTKYSNKVQLSNRYVTVYIKEGVHIKIKRKIEKFHDPESIYAGVDGRVELIGGKYDYEGLKRMVGGDISINFEEICDSAEYIALEHDTDITRSDKSFRYKEIVPRQEDQSFINTDGIECIFNGIINAQKDLKDLVSMYLDSNKS